MTKQQAYNKAEWLAKQENKQYCVLKALPNELPKGYYVESARTAPVSQVVCVFTPEGLLSRPLDF